MPAHFAVVSTCKSKEPTIQNQDPRKLNTSTQSVLILTVFHFVLLFTCCYHGTTTDNMAIIITLTQILEATQFTAVNMQQIYKWD